MKIDRPTINTSVKKIFVATPITSLLNGSGSLDPECKMRLHHILVTLKELFQAEVFCAIQREEWGAAIMSGDCCTPLDLQGLKESDLVLAFPANSYGVHVELGWASALNKPTIILNNSGNSFYSPLVEGLHTIIPTRYICFDGDLPFPSHSEWSENLLPEISRNVLMSNRNDDVLSI